MHKDLKFYIKLFVKKEEKNYNGKIVDTPSGIALELDRLSNSLSTEEREAFKYAKIPYITCNANNGKKYAFVNLSWLGTRTNYGEHNIIMHFRLSFETMIENPTMDNKYNELSFSFDFIEDMFERSSFSTQFPVMENDNEIKLSVKVPEDLKVELEDGTVVKVTSEFEGLVSSHHLYDINIEQKKRVHAKFPKKMDMIQISNFVEKLKLYFEFVYSYRLGLKDINLINIDIPKGYHLGKLSISELYRSTKSKSVVKFKSRYNGTPTELVERIKMWFTLYDKYEDSILIWKKTIYNDNIDENDKFIWTCQAFESLCQNDENIYSKALDFAKEKNKKKSYPNLSDYLKAVEEIIDFKFNNNSVYYRNIVKVRDKLTHNNPKKTITEKQRESSFKLIEYFYLSLIVSKLDKIKISRMIMLT